MSISAAFRSSVTNQCFIFVGDFHVILDYNPGSPKSKIIRGPALNTDMFPTPYPVIDCAFAFENFGAFLFFSDQCARVNNYSVTSENIKATLHTGPYHVSTMFPCLAGTPFSDGVQAAISFGTDVILFQSGNVVRLDYRQKCLVGPIMKIGECFPFLIGTPFEDGLSAGFASHIREEAYIFRGINYARININSAGFGGDGGFWVNGTIKDIRNEWPALRALQS